MTTKRDVKSVVIDLTGEHPTAVVTVEDVPVITDLPKPERENAPGVNEETLGGERPISDARTRVRTRAGTAKRSRARVSGTDKPDPVGSLRTHLEELATGLHTWDQRNPLAWDTWARDAAHSVDLAAELLQSRLHEVRSQLHRELERYDVDNQRRADALLARTSKLLDGGAYGVRS